MIKHLSDIASASDLTDESIAAMDKQQLINSIILSFDIADEFERIRIQALMQVRSAELNVSTPVNRMMTAYRNKDKAEERKYNRSVAKAHEEISLKYDQNGAPCVTIENFLTVMRNDPYYQGIRYNLLKNAPEVYTDDSSVVRLWEDADAAESRRYIEAKYNIHHESKHMDALRIFFRERKYHPIQDIVDAIEWDGVERIPQFLTKWMQAEDSPYVQEVSRLIFAGGIHRLYSPGCKFDDVPILIGTHQGEGKSTFVRWLAMNDSYFSEVDKIEGQEAIEQLEGAWICEITELLALTKAKEQEAVKSYITRQRDKYRKPYDRNVTEYPRRCIFIGTTNNDQFLKDKTGNRRFYPVEVHSSAYWLCDHEQECREYIVQCWGEARAKYLLGDMPNFANKELIEDFKSAQDAAMEDDWRVGAIEDYLEKQPVGSLVCVRQIKRDCLSESKDFPKDPTPKESLEISTMMNRFPEWEKAGRCNTRQYGRQRCWKRVAASPEQTEAINALPF